MRSHLFIFFAFGLAAVSCTQKETQQAISDKRVPVKLEAVRTIDHTIGVEASGILEPSDLIRLSFKTGGIIRNLTVSEGEQVSKGQILASLDMSEIDQRLSQAEAGIAQAQLNIERAEIAAEKASRDLESATNLLRDSVIIEDDFKNAETAFNLAEREKALAQQALAMAKSNQEIADFNAKHSVIYAPDNGKIMKRLAEPKELVAPGMPVYMFSTRRNSLSFKAGLSESDVVRINPGDKAEISFFAYPDIVFDGKVKEIAPAINPESATYDVEITVDSKGNKLLPGFVGNVKLFSDKKVTYLVVPAQALVEANGKTGFVFAKDEKGLARKVPIHIRGILDNDVIINYKGTQLDSVVTVGVEYLFSGTKVFTVKE